jgi:alpha-mannosidase
MVASLATALTAASYPQAEIETAWKQVLFNQFHDILPGSSIAPVFVDANRAWAEVKQIGMQILEASLMAIAAHITLPTPPHSHSHPILVFNSLTWERSEIVAIALPSESSDQLWQIHNLDGTPLPSQIGRGDDGTAQLLFLANAIPGIGYHLFWLTPSPHPPIPPSPHPPHWTLENSHLRVTINAKTGDIVSLFDKCQQREVLNAPGNQLQAFQDKGQYWDAWNIDPNYAQYPLPPAELKSIQWISWGELQQRIRVIRQLGQSEFRQDYVLDAHSALLKIETRVDWQEQHVMVKAAFPLTISADEVTYEIPAAAIARPTHSTDPHEQAKWEVPALQWADLSQEDYGVSLLNDCKYGYDHQPNQLRLTLLRSPMWPHPNCDRGLHRFTYAIYPHSGNWQTAKTVRRGYELNQPLWAKRIDPTKTVAHATLPPTAQLLDVSAENLILMALKPTEDEPKQWVMRCYECHGKVAHLQPQIQSDGLENWAIARVLNLLEQPDEAIAPWSALHQAYTIPPWRIATFLISFS